MADPYTGSLSEFFGGDDDISTGTSLTVSPKKQYTGSLNSFFDGDTDEEENLFSSTLPDNETLKIILNLQ